MSSMPIVRIFWSGGFDSSFRVVQLSKHNVTIQPYYICDDLRKSKQRELQAIASITEDIKNNPETNCTILPLIKKRVEDIPPDKEILEAYARLTKKVHLALQYYWFASFCKAENIFGVELGIEKEEHGGNVTHCIEIFGKITTIKEGNISYYIVDSAESQRDLSLVFGRFRFPIPLFDTTKKQLVELYKEYGYGHLIDKTWFCQSPMNGEPCGTCSPCRLTARAGMQFRFSDKALERYEKHHRRGELWRRIKSQLTFLLIKIRLVNVVRRILVILRQTQSQ